MPIFNTVKEWLYDCPVEQLQPYHKSQYNNLIDRDSAIRDMYLDDNVEPVRDTLQSDLFFILVRAVYNIDWNRMGDLCDMLVDEAVKYGELVCTECTWSGASVCLDCNGVGERWQLQDCPFCYNARKFACDYCADSGVMFGWNSCKPCGGSGAANCKRCGGGNNE